MKILFLSNFYPPHHIGGYGMLCMEVVDGLARRGHQTRVLTSTHGVGQPVLDEDIQRVLELESDLHFYQARHAWRYPMAKKRNLHHLRRLVAGFQPDLIFVWGMWCLTKQLAAQAETLRGSRVVYYLANPWPIEPNMHPAYWDDPARRWWRKALKGIARLPARLWLSAEWQTVPLKFEHAPCCSDALLRQLRTAGVPLQAAPVIYEGINLAPYTAQWNRRNGATPGTLSLLFVGILAPHKGVHTTIEALAHLSPPERQQVKLTILGSGHPLYEARLRELVETHHLSASVSFHQPIPRAELPEFLGRFDALLLPSTWEEPLARIMQEALASGAVVVGSATGGTKEIIVDGENGLLFPPENAPELAAKITRLLADQSLRRKLAANGHQTAVEKFDINRMVAEIETYLENVLAAGTTA